MKLIADTTREPRVGRASLTRQEWRIFLGIAVGGRGKRLAGDLGISLSNVSQSRRRVLDKLGIKTDAELAALAIHHGIVRVEP
jgi:two-component system invasion response regulator UvrY